FLPLPSWFMRRFHLGIGTAIALAGALKGDMILGAVLLLGWRFTQIRGLLPFYQEHFISFYQNVAVFLQERGIEIAGANEVGAYASENIPRLARIVFPQAAGFLGDGLLIAILATYFLVTMAEQQGAKRGWFAERLAHYGGDVQRYIAITAQTSAIAAIANFVLLVALGVDFPLLWCVMYFFMSFIPTLGFIAAIIPPILLALVMSGWTNALLVGGGLVLINLVQEYGLNPILMKKGVDVSFIEIILSLTFWSFLLGPAGAILAVPLTLALRKFIEKLRSERGFAGAPPG
ncbi:MAG: AI-2E family transporter, partial [Candidatus Binataceae bacterium]